MQLADKVAVITGGSSGIGRASAEMFVAEGARVVVGDIQDELGRELEAAYPGSVRYVHADVRREEDIAGLVDTAVDTYGRLDVMFNNAGSGGDQGTLASITVDGFEATLRLLLTSVVMGHKHAIRAFRAQDAAGSIISTSSVAGLQGGQATLSYTAAKHGIHGVVHQAAAELAPFGIRSNAIAPGIVSTGVIGTGLGLNRAEIDALNAVLAPRLASKQPLGRVGRGIDIAGAAVFLASDASAWLTGAVLPVDGGQTAVTMGGWMNETVGAVGEFMRARAR